MENFKGDETELKIQSVADPLLNIVKLGLDDFYANGFRSTPFITMLRDENRIPFSLKIKETFFTAFFLEALENFRFVGSFESYLLILTAAFGAETVINFEVPSPGHLILNVNFNQQIFELIGREFVDGAYVFYNVASTDSEDITCEGLTGVDTIEELELLFSEITPEGIFLDLHMNEFDFDDFIDHLSNSVVDHSGNILYFKSSV